MYDPIWCPASPPIAVPIPAPRRVASVSPPITWPKIAPLTPPIAAPIPNPFWLRDALAQANSEAAKVNANIIEIVLFILLSSHIDLFLKYLILFEIRKRIETEAAGIISKFILL
jgi:hypothetical protein